MMALLYTLFGAGVLLAAIGAAGLGVFRKRKTRRLDREAGIDPNRETR